VGSSGCNCPLGYSGIRCDIADVIDHCLLVPGEVCLHGGMCYGADPNKPCDCSYGHAGKNCEIRGVVKCGDGDDVYCRNGGVCNAANTGCVCSFGFMGATCAEVNYEQIRNGGVSDASGSSSDADARLAVAVAVPLLLVITLICCFGGYMVRKERQGKPLFVKQLDDTAVEMGPSA